MHVAGFFSVILLGSNCLSPEANQLTINTVRLAVYPIQLLGYNLVFIFVFGIMPFSEVGLFSRNVGL